MTPDLKRSLELCETDINGAMARFVNNEALYIACLGEFLKDPTMAELDAALESRSWDAAFTAAHALKGVAGNMGFVPLFHSSAALVVLIRAGRVDEVDGVYNELKRCYDRITAAIGEHFGAGQKGE